MNSRTKSKRVYPPRVILDVMRVAIIALAIMLIIVGFRVNSYGLLAQGWHRVPFWASGVVAGVWVVCICRPLVVVWCSALLSVAFIMRGMELALWGPGEVAFAATATWIVLGIWSFLLGVINQIIVSQKRAGELWDCLQPPQM
jgi:hypothetical protein